MLWESGRLLFRAARWARSGVHRRVRPLLHRLISRGRPTSRQSKALAAGLALALLGVLVFAALPGGSSGTHRLARGASDALDLAAGDIDATGSASVSVTMAGSHLSPGTARAVKPSARHALLIGINNAQGAPHLEGAVTDALNVKQALLDYGFPAGNITTLLDADASRDAILKGLDDLVRQTPPSGIAVVALAAHTRRKDGIDQLLAADGARIDSTEIASRLSHLRARAWIALPTCYAEGYALPGIVGPNRIATFASSAQSESYELGSAGSYLIIDMVRKAMIERQAPYSVEAAFDWARDNLERTHPNRVPIMSDGIPGDLVLGPRDGLGSVSSGSRPPSDAQATAPYGPPAGQAPAASSPPADPSNGRRHGVSVCSNRATVNCDSP